MIATILILAVALGYVAYRLSFNVRALRAQRAGDSARSDHLRGQGAKMGIGIKALLTLALLVLGAVAVASHN